MQIIKESIAQTLSGSKRINRTNATDVLSLGTGLGIDGIIRGYSNAYFDGNVGIGTADPGQKLTVMDKGMAPTSYDSASFFYGYASGSSSSDNYNSAVLAQMDNVITGSSDAYGNALFATAGTGNDGDRQVAIGVRAQTTTHANDIGYILQVGNAYTGGNYPSTGGTQYGLYIDMPDADVTNYGIYQVTPGKNYFAGNIGIGRSDPQSGLHVADGKYVQFQDNNAGAPPAADCDNDDERGRLSIDTTNNRLYICIGAARGWDYISLNN